MNKNDISKLKEEVIESGINEKITDTSEYNIRTQKVNDLKKSGEIPYSSGFKKTHSISEIKEMEEGSEVSVAGRIVAKRSFGKFMFLQLQDVYQRIQISLSINDLFEERYTYLKNYVDIADHIGVTGTLYRTKTNELTVKVQSFTLLSKSLRPLPEKWSGLENVDSRYRQRYLDLVANEEVRSVFVTRSKVLTQIRNFLNENDFLEVETPILQSVATGAVAKPFVTKHNSLDKDYFLRIAPELFLKQTVAGGFDRVYEIGKNFRNEGMDASHLQEFTMLEWYAAYWDYTDNIVFSTQLVRNLVKNVTGKGTVEFSGHVIDFDKEWERLDYCKEISSLLTKDVLSFESTEELKEAIKKFELLSDEDLEKAKSIPALIDLLFKRKVRPFIIQPTILYNYPAAMIPLARRSDDNEKVIEMFQVVIAGWEIIKAYSELIDPAIQREMFIQQAQNKAQGDEEAMEIDESFLLSMEHGMPPMSGLGLGIDRLIAILCNQSTLRDVVLFPQVR